jgi:hypothetical protein
MIVVVSIIGLIVGVSYPSISAGLDSVRMTSATDSVAAFLNGAVTRAQRRQRPVELVVSIRDNLLALYSSEAGYHRELRMPDGIIIEAVLPAPEGIPDEVRRFLIVPGGIAPSVGIQLANKRDGHRLVKLDPMTGFPHVEAVNTK